MNKMDRTFPCSSHSLQLIEKKNELQTHGAQIRDINPAFFNADEAFWESFIGLKPGDTLSIAIGIPREDLKDNSTQGFGFEAAEFTLEDLQEFFRTGNPSKIGNLIWPAINIATN